MGASYLFSCFLKLTAPGVPIKLKYKSPGGELILTAQSFDYNPKGGTLIVINPKLEGPKGLIAGASRVDASGLAYNRADQTPIRLSVFEGQAVIRRVRNGQFELQDFLPKSTGAPSQVAFSVLAKNAKVTLIDSTGSSEWIQQAAIKSLAVDGVGGEWLASGSGSIDGAGSASVELQNVPGKGMFIKGDTPGLNLAGLFDRFKTIREGRDIEPLRHVQVASIRADGPFSLFIPSNAQASFAADIDATATGFSYDNYKFDSGKFNGRITQDGLVGRGQASTGALTGTYDGSVTWKNGADVGTKLVLSATSISQLPDWLRKLIPKEIDLRDAHFDGWLAYDKPHGLTIDAGIMGASGQAYGEKLDAPKMELHVDKSIVHLGQIQALWHGNPVSGALDIGLQDHRLAGVFSSPTVDLRSVASRFNQKGISGTAEARVLLTGTTTSPGADFEANGRADYKSKVRGDFQLNGRYQDRVLVVTRGLAHAEGGTLLVDGRINSNEDIHMRVEAANLMLAPFLKDAEGAGNFTGSVDGTLRSPRIKGKAEAYGITYQGHVLPFAGGNLQADMREARLTNFHAQQGPTEAKGDLTYRYSDGRLNGAFGLTSFQPSEFLGQDFAGFIDVPKLTVGGTAKNPVAAGRIEGTDLFYHGRRLNALQANVRLENKELMLDDLAATLFDGSLSGSGGYDLTGHTGSFKFAAKGLVISDAVSLPADVGALEGRFDASASIGINADGVISSTAAGTLNDLKLNETELGSGDFSLKSQGDVIQGLAQIGNLDGYERIEHFTYNADNQQLDAQVLFANTPLTDVYRSTRRLFGDLPPTTNQLLRGTTGTLNLEATLHGLATNPDVSLQSLDVTDLTVLGRKTGELKVAGSRTGDSYNGVVVSWEGPAGILKGTGSADLNGNFSLDADLSNFDLSMLGLASDSLSALRGQVTVSVLGSGPTRDPVFRATANSKGAPLGVVNADGSITYVPDFGIDVDTITIKQSHLNGAGVYEGGIDASGRLTFRGVEGQLTASSPLLYPFRIPEGAPISANLDLPAFNDAEKDMARIHTLFPSIDVTQSEASIGGHIGLHGPLDALAFDGSLNLLAKKLAFQGVPDKFQDLAAELKLDGNDFHATGKATAVAGGDVTLDATVHTPGVRTMVDRLESGGDSGQLASTLTGSFSGNRFTLNEPLPGKGHLSGIVDGKLDLSGDLTNPAIGGSVTVANGKVVLPTDEIKTGSSPEFAIDPKFDIKLAIADSMNIKSPAANVDLGGSGTLEGSLKQPLLGANLLVQKGTFKLPTATVTLEPDGIIRPSYHPGSADGHDARIDVDLEGRTRLTAKGINERPQSYDIRLNIRGDLLQNNGLQLDASANPPDLTQDQILALLGQTSSITGIGGGGPAESRIRTALAGFALPSLLDPITSRIGETLGLESLTLQYDLQNQASISFAKALGKDFVLSGSREITQPLPGYKPQFDFELSYRSPKLRRFTFSIGADQDRPYKLSIEYGFRF